MSPEPGAIGRPHGATIRSWSAPSSRPASAVALVAVGFLGGVVGAAAVLFTTHGMPRGETPQDTADIARLEVRVSELESRPVSKLSGARASSVAMAELRRGSEGEADREAPGLEELTEHPRFAEAVGDVIEKLEAARQVAKADEQTRRSVDRILAFTDSLSEQLRLTETQRLEVARILTDESSRYRRAKVELNHVTVDEGLTPREKRERRAKVRERIAGESRDELSRILSSDQLAELLRIREEEGIDPDD